MNVIYNGTSMTISKITTLNELLIYLNVSEPFAVAVNNKFVPKILFNTTTIVSGDNIEIVYPMVGG